MNMQALLKQAQRLQKDVTKKEQELSEKIYESTIGGGVVKVIAKGDISIKSIAIDEILLKEGKEDLEEMLLSAINDALQQAVKDKETSMDSITGGIKMPGSF